MLWLGVAPPDFIPHWIHTTQAQIVLMNPICSNELQATPQKKDEEPLAQRQT